jgi:hypothetical protein
MTRVLVVDDSQLMTLQADVLSDAVLRKPEDIQLLADLVTRLGQDE